MKKPFWKSKLVILCLVSILAFGAAYATQASDFAAASDEVHAEEAAEAEHGDSEGHSVPMALLWIPVILIIAKISGLVERWGQPSVLGELVIGVVLGNLALIGIEIFEPIKHNEIIKFLSELGVIILLFQIGLESNIQEMKKVGGKAFAVAVVGVVAPFVLGTYVIGPWLLPDLTYNAYLFLGAALTATSVGITARVFKDLGKLQTKEAKVILGAAVIDDVLGLIILAVVSAMATLGAVSFGTISWITAKAVLFLVGAIVIGILAAPRLSKWFSKIHPGTGMKFTLAVSFGLVFAWVAGKMGLAPIVGAFAAGLVLDPVHFDSFKCPNIVSHVRSKIKGADEKLKLEVNKVIDKHSYGHVEELIEPLGFFLIPIFFVTTGMAVDLSVLSDVKVLLVALVISVVAIIGKYVAGVVAGRGVNKTLIGFGMVPRGEVGLIFAAIGKGIGVVNDEVFSIIIIMVILTTLVTPPILAVLLKKQDAA